jgi:hypothetical protein
LELSDIGERLEHSVILIVKAANQRKRERERERECLQQHGRERRESKRAESRSTYRDASGQRSLGLEVIAYANYRGQVYQAESNSWKNDFSIQSYTDGKDAMPEGIADLIFTPYLPPMMPYVIISIFTLFENVESTNAMAPKKLPAIHTALHPYLFVKALTTGPTRRGT